MTNPGDQYDDDLPPFNDGKQTAEKDLLDSALDRGVLGNNHKRAETEDRQPRPQQRVRSNKIVRVVSETTGKSTTKQHPITTEWVNKLTPPKDYRDKECIPECKLVLIACRTPVARLLKLCKPVIRLKMHAFISYQGIGLLSHLDR